MTWYGTPWFVGGGAEHAPEVARALAYAATGGAEGVGSVADLKVRAAATPGASIIAGQGTAMMLNRYSGGNDRQSYMGFNASDDTKPVTVGGVARSDLVVARVIDPQYGDTAPASLVNGPYIVTEVIPNVPSTTTTFKQLGRNYPAVELARIDMPTGTTAITSGMIVDLRKLAQPRAQRQVYSVQFSNGYSVGELTGVQWMGNPNSDPSGIIVPTWATKVVARFDVEQGTLVNSSKVQVAGNGSATGYGRLGPRTGSLGVTLIRTADTSWRWDASTAGVRSSVGFADTMDVPAAMRGALTVLGVDAKRTAGNYPFIDVSSYGYYDLEFIERI